MSKPDAVHPGDDSLRLAMVASGIGMAIVDLDRRWVEVNPAFERIFGYAAGEMLGRATAEFTHPDDRARASAALDELIAGRAESFDAHKRYLHRNGETIWTHANVALLRNAAGAPRNLLVQLRDVGDEHEAEHRQRVDTRTRAEALDASRRQLQLFADAVAHDLRAPLRSIESFSALLDSRAGEQLDATARDHLDRIRNAASRMSSLLAALGDLSHATRVELKPGPVDISLLADWVLVDLQEADPQREVESTVQPGLDAYGDEHLLKMLLAQLLGNAWTFSRERVPARIEVGGHSGADGLHLHVRDNGSGFDMRYAHKLFQPFQRLHGPDEGGGHGLGLAIAQRIAEPHHGHLRAESEPGIGTTFHLDLPAADSIDAGSIAASSPPAPPQGTDPGPRR